MHDGFDIHPLYVRFVFYFMDNRMRRLKKIHPVHFPKHVVL